MVYISELTLLSSFLQRRCFFYCVHGFWEFTLENVGFIPQNISAPSVNFPPSYFALSICLDQASSHRSWTQCVILESKVSNYLCVGLRTLQFLRHGFSPQSLQGGQIMVLSIIWYQKVFNVKIFHSGRGNFFSFAET